MAQAEQQKKMHGLAGQFRTPAVGMAADGFGPSTPAGFDREGYASALEALDPMAGLQYAANIQKQTPKLTAYKPGDSVRDESGREVFSVPQDPKDAPKTDLAKLLAERNALPEGDPSRALYDKQILKITTHQSPVSVSYGAPVAGVNAAGESIFFQPGKNGGAPAVIPGVAPPAKPPSAELNKSVVGLNELSNALNTYKAELKANGGPAAFATGETKGKLQGSYTALQMGLKNAFELGALAGPDLELLQGMLVDPTSAKSIMYGNKGVDAQIAQAEKYIKNRGNAVFKANKMPVPKEYEIGGKSFADYGYKTQEDALNDGKNAIMRNPINKAEVLKRLSDMGINTAGM